MTQSEKRRHQAMGGKTARSCDGCLRGRARFYCAVDDAFLCQGCDYAVHSANSLARSHEDVQLRTSSTCSALTACPARWWSDGCKRKARTPRAGGRKDDGRRCRLKSGPLVPEIGTPSSSSECTAVDEEHLIHLVPIYDPVLSEFCTPAPAADKDDVKPEVGGGGGGQPAQPVHGKGPTGFHTHGMGLGELEYDVESLLGHGLDAGPCMDGLGLSAIGSTEKGRGSCGGETGELRLCPPTGDYKPVKEEERYADGATADIKLDCGCPSEGGDVSDEDNVTMKEGKKKKIMLKLDYESVITAWSTQKSPWADGKRPKLDCGDYFSDLMGMVSAGGAESQGGARRTIAGGGREARVSRYREKRRTRLFSKKIRYEVRKLNAEKRPRMRGRFVKRAPSFAASPATKITSATASFAAPQYIFSDQNKHLRRVF